MRSITDDLPLRTTAVWGGFREVAVIPHRYGRTGGTLLQYDDSRRLWVWADHDVSVVDQVQVNGVAITDWTWRNAVDSSGHPIALVELGQPNDDGAEISADGIGKRHPRTGAVLESPALVLWDLIANVAGVAAAESAFDEFHRACSALGLKVGGSIVDVASAQAVAAELCRSIGARFSPTMPGWARVFPGGPSPAFASGRVDVDASAEASVAFDQVLTVCVVNYAFRAKGARAVVELDAPAAVRRYGRRVLELDAPWVDDARVAYDVAARLLQHQARPVYALDASNVRGRIRPGQAIKVLHPFVPFTGLVPVLGATYSFRANRSSCSAEVAVGPVPAVRLVRQARGIDAAQYQSAEIRTVGAERLVTLRNQDGSPLANAAVTLNGGITRYTDAGGLVLFPVASMPRGTHTLTIAAPGGNFTVQVTV